MRILLTGAAGFIGSAIVDLLAAAGHEVVGLDLLIPQAHAVLSEPPPGTRIGDVRDRNLVAELMNGVDAVCHQAAMVGLGVDLADTPDYMSHNVTGTATVLSAAAAAGVRTFVQASSMVVYGEGAYRCVEHGPQPPGARTAQDLRDGRFEHHCARCGRPLDWALVAEDALLKPRSMYAVSKLAQEQLAAVWARSTGGRAISLRYHNVYGPGMPRDTPYSGVAAMFRSALERGEPPTVLEDGRQQRDFVHVRDVAAANVAALDAAHRSALPAGEMFALNVASGQPHTVGELAKTLAAAMNGPEPRIVGGCRPGDVRHVVADPARSRRLLDLPEPVDFTRGVAEFATAPLRGTGRSVVGAGT